MFHTTTGGSIKTSGTCFTNLQSIHVDADAVVGFSCVVSDGFNKYLQGPGSNAYTMVLVWLGTHN